MEGSKDVRTSILFSSKPAYTRLGIISKLLDRTIGATISFLVKNGEFDSIKKGEFLEFQMNQDIYAFRKTVKFEHFQELWDLKGFQEKMDLPLDRSIDLLIYGATKKLFQDKSQFKNFWKLTSSSQATKSLLL